jgi:hypothetical protein
VFCGTRVRATLRLLPFLMSRTAQTLTANEAAEIMHVALGEPPAPSPGCVRLLLGCWQVLSDEWDPEPDAMLKQHRDLFALWMRFLVFPRSPEEIRALFTHIESCRCRVGPQAVREAPWDLHDHFKGPNCAVPRFATMLCRELVARLENRRDIAQLYSARDREAWPRSLQEILPFEPNLSLHMLGTWIFAPGDTPTTMIGGMLRLTIDTFKARLLLGVVKSHTLWHWLTRTVVSVAARVEENTPPMPVSTAGNLLFFLSEAGELITAMLNVMFDAELLLWAKHGAVPLDDIIDLCILAVDAIPQVLGAIPTSSHTEEMYEYAGDSDDAWGSMAVRFTHMGGSDAQPLRLREYLPQTIRLLLRDERTIRADPHIRFLNAACSSQWKQRCYAPACLETFASVGRKFQACEACKTATYCSRSCQKAAWNHPGAPHRGLMCSLLHRARRSRQLASDGTTAFSGDDFSRAVSIELAQAGYQNVTTLIRLKTVRLGMCSSSATEWYRIHKLTTIVEQELDQFVIDPRDPWK